LAQPTESGAYVFVKMGLCILLTAFCSGKEG